MKQTVAFVVAMVVLLLLPMSAALAQSIETIEVTGRVEHGVEDATFDPTQVRVTLNVLEGMLEGITSISQDTVVPDADGSFRFEVAFTAGRTLFFTIDYQGAVYSVVRDSESLSEPVVITVFDSTHDTSVLAVVSYTLFITGADAEQGFIEILERAVVRNDSNLTLAPDQEAQGPAMLSFMRFALPPNAYNLDVRSNLVGGQVLEVDRGFALTTPIPPTPDDEPHQFEFVYRLDYDERSLNLSRTMRFGAGSFRFVVPVDIGTPASPRLDDLGATDFNGRLLRLLEGQDIQPAEVISLTVSGLPMPSVFDHARAMAGEWYVQYVTPAVIGATGVVLLFVIFRRRLRVREAQGEALRQQILAEADALRDAYDRRAISEAAYQARLRILKDDLVRLEIQERLRTMGDAK